MKEGSLYDLSPNFSLKEDAVFDEKVSIHESMYKRSQANISQASRNSIMMKRKRHITFDQKIRDLEGMVENTGRHSINQWSPLLKS